MEDGLGVGEYMEKSPPNSTMRKLLEKAEFLSSDEEWYGGCHTTKTRESGRYASICDIHSVTDLISRDYRENSLLRESKKCFSLTSRLYIVLFLRMNSPQFLYKSYSFTVILGYATTT